MVNTDRGWLDYWHFVKQQGRWKVKIKWVQQIQGAYQGEERMKFDSRAYLPQAELFAGEKNQNRNFQPFKRMKLRFCCKKTAFEHFLKKLKQHCQLGHRIWNLTRASSEPEKSVWLFRFKPTHMWIARKALRNHLYNLLSNTSLQMFWEHSGTPASPVLPGVQAPLDSSQCCDVTLQTTAVTVSNRHGKSH